METEPVRRLLAADAGEGRQLTPIPSDEALRLLSGVPFGRIVFTIDVLPTIRVVNHVVDDGRVVFRTHPAGGIAAGLSPFEHTVVVYEADQIDPETRTGWSVIVTGQAEPVSDVDELVKYMHLLTPWVAGTRNAVIAIEPRMVTGFRLE